MRVRPTTGVLVVLLGHLTALCYAECAVLESLTAVRQARIDAQQAANELLAGGH